mgnify:CR=1 FL=1|jgi:hypothetical protein
MLNEKKFLAIYDEFLDSGLTIRDFCANQHMNEAKFYYWQNKLKGQLPPKKGFVPVVFGSGQKIPQVSSQVQNRQDGFSGMPVVNTPIFCEINFPGGTCIKLNGLTDPEMFRSLLLLARQ